MMLSYYREEDMSLNTLSNISRLQNNPYSTTSSETVDVLVQSWFVTTTAQLPFEHMVGLYFFSFFRITSFGY